MIWKTIIVKKIQIDGTPNVNFINKINFSLIQLDLESIIAKIDNKLSR